MLTRVLDSSHYVNQSGGRSKIREGTYADSLGGLNLRLIPGNSENRTKKKTDIWGQFKIPQITVVEKPAELLKFSLLKSKEIRPEMYGKLSRTERRAMTPEGFATAFFKANP